MSKGTFRIDIEVDSFGLDAEESVKERARDLAGDFQRALSFNILVSKMVKERHPGKPDTEKQLPLTRFMSDSSGLKQED